MVTVLSSRILLRPTDPERSRAFYRDGLGLAVYREFGTGPERGTVFFLGGGFLEVSGRGDTAARARACGCGSRCPTCRAAHESLLGRGVEIAREPRREPWGLIEMWLSDPDGVRICVVEVPEDHPIRYRP